MCIFIGVNRICSLLSRERKNEKYVFLKENEEMTWETGQTTANDGERNYLLLKMRGVLLHDAADAAAIKTHKSSLLVDAFICIFSTYSTESIFSPFCCSLNMTLMIHNFHEPPPKIEWPIKS